MIASMENMNCGNHTNDLSFVHNNTPMSNDPVDRFIEK